MVSQPTVTDHQTSSKHAFRADDEPARRGWFRRRRDTDEPFVPSKQSRWVLAGVRAEVRKLTEPAKKPEAKDAATGSHPAYLLRELARRALELHEDTSLNHRRCVVELHSIMERFSEGALAEDAIARSSERRGPQHTDASAAQGKVLFDAGRRGEAIGPDSPRGREAVGDIVARALRTSDPTPTAQFPAITPDMPDPRIAQPASPDIATGASAPTSPVHRDSAPPVPDEPVPTGEALPHREPGCTPEGGESA